MLVSDNRFKKYPVPKNAKKLFQIQKKKYAQIGRVAKSSQIVVFVGEYTTSTPFDAKKVGFIKTIIAKL